jgi:putative membrane protein
MRLRNSTVLLAACLVPAPALAHASGQPGTLAWSFEPLVLVSVFGAGIWYVIGLIRMREETTATVISRGNIGAFVAGLGVVFVALTSPVDTVGEELFSVHMVQHLLLMLFAAPLLVLGRPAIAFLWAMPPRMRKGFGRTWTAGRFGRLIAFLMQPLIVWVLFAGVFVFWHLPAPYTWALTNEMVHDCEHLSFLIVSLMFWTIVFEPSGRRRLDYGATLLFVATMAIFSGLPGALMILTSRAFYTAHAVTVGQWGLTLVQDQQLAGLIMWIPAGMVYVAAVSWLFWRWLDNEARRKPAARMRSLSSAPALSCVTLMAFCLILGGRGDVSTDANAEQAKVSDPGRGSQVIAQYGCGTCHTIPGIAGADGNVGPPLTGFARRVYIAGMLRNTPENLQHWLQDPQSVVPGNVMPNVGLTDKEARDAAAYLYTLN